MIRKIGNYEIIKSEIINNDMEVVIARDLYNTYSYLCADGNGIGYGNKRLCRTYCEALSELCARCVKYSNDIEQWARRIKPIIVRDEQ